MGILSDLFGGSSSGTRFGTKGTSKGNGGKYHGVRQDNSGYKAGYQTYEKSTGRGKGRHANREHAGPDFKRRK